MVPVPTCSADYPAGMVVDLVAVSPAGGNTFVGWSGDYSGTSTTCSVTMNQARNVTAAFEP